MGKDGINMRDMQEEAMDDERATGKWIGEEVWIGGHQGEELCWMECSNCHKVRLIDNYCSNCGAKMEMEKKGG